ncbi:GPI anchored serine-rich protein [Apiospora kogelbergensis]|uniref:GPI anchored serine-rich protein n=1 Tax=Apiospora kogelbergensis TaxID=1337665 RepID=UPI003131EF25
MQFAATAALFATAVAGNMVYETQYHTITSCAPEVTNCPAKSTVTSSTVYAVTTPAGGYPVSSVVPSKSAVTSPAVPVVPTGGKPSGPYDTAPAPYPVESVTSNSPVKPTQPGAPGLPVTSVQTISTCMPTVIYSTVTVGQGVPTGPAGGNNGGYPSPSAGLPSPPSPSSTYPVTAGAGAVGASVFAAAAGLVAAALI